MASRIRQGTFGAKGGGHLGNANSELRSLGATPAPQPWGRKILRPSRLAGVAGLRAPSGARSVLRTQRPPWATAALRSAGAGSVGASCGLAPPAAALACEDFGPGGGEEAFAACPCENAGGLA